MSGLVAIVVGGRAWRVITGYGHAPEHASLHCEALGLAISGDMLLPTISTHVGVWATDPEGDPLGHFLRSIRRFRELPADTLMLPSLAKSGWLPADFMGAGPGGEQLLLHPHALFGVVDLLLREAQHVVEPAVVGIALSIHA